jgi:DNA repair exonuclease SbcCD nuclease subunit
MAHTCTMGSHVRLLHSSDVHLGDAPRDCISRRALQALVAAGNRECVDVLLLAGDIFDNSRVPDDLVVWALAELSRFDGTVVLLPGNHDCLEEERSVYRRPVFATRPAHIQVLGVPHETIELEALSLEIWGRPIVVHDRASRPLANVPRRGSSRWRVLIGHGHLESERDAGQRSSPIQRDEIAAADAEYVALGHWDYLTDVSTERVTAYYSGAPYHGSDLDFANLVTLGPGRTCQVTRVALAEPVDDA